jgi:hypothetical protein
VCAACPTPHLIPKGSNPVHPRKNIHDTFPTGTWPDTTLVKKDKTKYKTRVMEQKQHKVVILIHSHARRCATEVKHLLNNNFEVFGFVNPGSGMEFIKETAKLKLQQLTKNDVVVLKGGSNDIARNNSIRGIMNILDFVINANHTNVIIMSSLH